LDIILLSARISDYFRNIFNCQWLKDGTKVWTRLLGTTNNDQAPALSIGIDGSMYVGGVSYGPLNGYVNSSDLKGAFLTKYSADGTISWTSNLLVDAHPSALTTGLDGAIYISGFATESIHGQPFSGVAIDAFLTKYSADGTEVWTRSLGSSSDDRANALTTGLDGSIYVSGYTAGSLDGLPFSGFYDAFLTKYSPDGTKAWTRLLGSSNYEQANALTTGLDGSIYVGGYTSGSLDGQTNNGSADAFLTKYGADGTKAWTRLLGSSTDGHSWASGNDQATALSTGLDGSIYLGGYTDGSLDGQANSGFYDAFLTKYSPDGALCALNDDAINPRAPRPVSAWEGTGPDCGWRGRARGTIPGSFPDTTWPPL
jgi:hypothetical protein